MSNPQIEEAIKNIRKEDVVKGLLDIGKIEKRFKVVIETNIQNGKLLITGYRRLNEINE